MEGNSSLSANAKEIIKTITYFDIFSYPLTANEIRERCRIKGIKLIEVTELLNSLVQQKLLFKSGNFFSLNHFVPDEDRSIKNRRAKKYIYLGKKMGVFLGKFPFIKAVTITGSTAKGNAYSGSDIDFMIVTEPGRVWMVRTILIIYRLFRKKILKKSRKLTCFNLFINSEYIFTDRNIFTAYEIITTIPVYNENVISSFFENHNWVNSFFPNFRNKLIDNLTINEAGKFKKVVELLLNNIIGDILEKGAHIITLYRRSYSHKKLKLNKTQINSQSKLNDAIILSRVKQNHQTEIMRAYGRKITDFENKYNLSLNET